MARRGELEVDMRLGPGRAADVRARVDQERDELAGGLGVESFADEIVRDAGFCTVVINLYS